MILRRKYPNPGKKAGIFHISLTLYTLCMSLNILRRPRQRPESNNSLKAHIEMEKESPEECSHGMGLADVCEACVQESRSKQPVWEVISRISEQSKFQRSHESPECTLEREGERYQIRMTRPEDTKTIREIHTLLQETFDAEEVEPEDSLREGLKGKKIEGSPLTTRYRIFVARDSSDQLQSLYGGQLVDIIRDGGNAPHDELLFMGMYAAVREESQRKGLVRELYTSSMMEVAADAHALGKTLTTIAGECTEESEGAWNAMGRRRVYVQTGPHEYSELPYIQPALSFNHETGLPAHGAGEMAEHIMLQFLTGEPTKERVSAAVASMYRCSNTWPEHMFANKRAYQSHLGYINRLRSNFDSFLMNNGDLLLLTAEERKEMVEKGVAFREHSEANDD